MNRRNFIRIVGGGVVLASGLAACSSQFPDQAVAAWKGPGDESDLRRWALGYAILAPNSHNRQPWLVDLREANAITLYVDRERLLPMTDPWFRQMVVAQGTFLESLVLALKERGVSPDVKLFPQGEFAARELDDRPVARVSWSLNEGAKGVKDPLFAQLLKRHTAKVDYDTARPVTAATLDALKAALVDLGVRYGATVDGPQVEVMRQLCLDSARVELLTPRTVMESNRLTRVGPDEITKNPDGISINGWLPRIAAKVGAFDRENPPAEGSTAYKQMLGYYEGVSKTAMGFIWLSTPTVIHGPAGTTRTAEVNAGRAYMRLQLMGTELGLQMNPMSQAPQEFPEMKAYYDQLHQLLLGKPATEETVQMFCRVGYCAPQQHTPRRGVDAIIRA